MQNKSRVKLLSIFTAIVFFSGMLQSVALADSSGVSGNEEKGLKLWTDNCSRCHNFRSPKEYTAKDWHVIMQHMRVQAGLTGQEARDVYAYLVKVAQGSDDAPQVAADPVTATPQAEKKSVASQEVPQQSSQAASKGKAVYLKTCVACHGSNGKGAVPAAPDLTSKNSPLYQSDAVVLAHMENGFQSPGSQMAMPAKGGDASLTKQDLQDVLLYMKSKFAH